MKTTCDLLDPGWGGVMMRQSKTPIDTLIDIMDSSKLAFALCVCLMVLVWSSIALGLGLETEFLLVKLGAYPVVAQATASFVLFTILVGPDLLVVASILRDARDSNGDC
jgi:hypothetical protein